MLYKQMQSRRQTTWLSLSRSFALLLMTLTHQRFDRQLIKQVSFSWRATTPQITDPYRTVPLRCSLGLGTTSARTEPHKSAIVSDDALVEKLFLRHGNFANAYSVAFDSDLERYVHSPCDGSLYDSGGIVAYSRCGPFALTCVFFDPLCSVEALPSVLDGFLKWVRQEFPQDRVMFWKISATVTELLLKKGYSIAPYGFEHDVVLPRANLSGKRFSWLRREIQRSRRAGFVIEAVRHSTIWAELDRVTQSWLSTRPQWVWLKRQVRRVTRRAPHRSEIHCTKVVARRPDGSVVGWAALDHIYSNGVLVGCAPNLRYNPEAGKGISALLALDGAEIVRQQYKRQGDFRLALGESPLAEFPGDQTFFPRDIERRSRVLEYIFSVIRENGRWLYGVRGIADWKRKWRADNLSTTFIAVDTELPWRAVLSTLALMYGD